MTECIVCNKSFNRPSRYSRAKTCSNECSIARKKSHDEKRLKDPKYLESRRNNPKIKEYANEYNHRPEVLKRRAELASQSRKNGKFTGWIMKAWSDAVKDSWNYTCAMCSSTEKLEAHHIIPREIMPEYASLINNGICLCKTCHRDVHIKLKEHDNAN